MNNRGQITYFFLLMMGVVIFILSFSLAKPLVTNSAKVMVDLDCANGSIDTSQKVLCQVVDITAPFLISVIIALGFMSFGARLIT